MRNVFFLLILCFSPGLISAQGWQRYYSGDRALRLQTLPDGSFIAAGNAKDSTGGDHWYTLRTDADGHALLEQFGGSGSVLALVPAPGNQWRLYGNTAPDSVFTAITGTNATYVTHGNLYQGRPTIDGGAVLCGTRSSNTTNNVTFALTLRTDESGTLTWERVDSIGLSASAWDVVETPDGGTLVTGNHIRSESTPDEDIFVFKTDPSGQLLWQKRYQWPNTERVAKIVKMPSDNWLLAASIQNLANPGLLAEDIFLIHLNNSGDTLWTRTLPMPGYQLPHAAVVLPDGRIAIAGETRMVSNSSRDAFLALTDPSGHLLWYKTYGGIKGDIFQDMQVMPDGGFILSGQTASFGDGTLHAWLVRTDSLGNVWSNYLYGTVARDENTPNCLVETTETPLANWIVAASGTPGTWYTNTASDGTYEMTLDTGVWYVSVLPPTGYWTACADSLPVTFTGLMDSVTLDFSVQAAYQCPLLQVDITTPYLRRCFENTFSVRYFNYGTSAAPESRVEVLLDPYLTVTGSSLPYTNSGDTLFFETGAVPALSGGGFSFTALLDCDNTVLGQSHCTEAHIYPDSLCYALAPQWDGAHLEVSGYCAGDSVVLIITNTGLGGMTDPVEYVITEDQIIFKQAALQLAAGESTAIVVYPNGATVTLVVPQTAGHPGNSTPMLVIEGCGGMPFSTGYAFQFPTDDGDPFTDIECRANIGSFDPNDKVGLPAGVEGIITPETPIEYLIRFQNTGSDTAFRVEIRDTLPVELEISTFEQGAASHPFRLEISGPGILRFIFDPILLPDSTANVALSQGFVKYRITPKRGLPPGTFIRNRAGIYFDFNAPVMTEATVHQIGAPLSHLLSALVEPEHHLPIFSAIQATPNPFYERTMLRWTGTENGDYQIQVSDIAGKIKLSKLVHGNYFEIDAGDWPEGYWNIEVRESGWRVANGRLIRVRRE